MSRRPQESTKIVLQANHLYKSFDTGAVDIAVLDDANVSVHRGERIAVVGRSGSGKSTLLHVLAGLDEPDSGEVLINADISMTKASVNERAALRARQMGFVYQNHHLLPEFSAAENVAMPLRIAGLSAKQARIEALSLIDEVGLSQRESHFPSELSGGERQRVAVARALAGQPSIVLADEPTGNLDAHTAQNVITLMTRLSEEHNTAFLVVTHDSSMLTHFHRVLTLAEGQLQPFHETQVGVS